MGEFLLTLERTVVMRERARVVIEAGTLEEAKTLAQAGDWKPHRGGIAWLSWRQESERVSKTRVVRSRKRTKKDKRVHLPCGHYGWAQAHEDYAFCNRCQGRKLRSDRFSEEI